MATEEAKSIDQASVEMIEKATTDGANTAFDRAEAMKPSPEATRSWSLIRASQIQDSTAC